MKKRLLREALSLPIGDRMELADAIWETLPEDADAASFPVSAAHRAVLDQRLADLAADPDAGSSWDEVRDDLRARRSDRDRR